MEPQLCLAGASTDTGNLGVSALCLAALRTLFLARSGAKVTVFDEGRGRRQSVFESDSKTFPHKLCGEKLSRRYWQAESLWNIRLSSWLGGGCNASARAILEAHAVLDISGGDSFTDLYGPRRFRAVAMFKQIVLEGGVPLILLPQTYGPFADRARRGVAKRIIAGAAMAWSRDARSHEFVQELLGKQFDPARHRSGVDVAFELESRQPSHELSDSVMEWISRGPSSVVVGLNVSGLLFNSPDGGREQYGLVANYREVILELTRRLIRDGGCRVLLVPHVITPVGHYESDVAAAQTVASILSDEGDGRIMVLKPPHDPREMKWVISRVEWFCGTRMHATIAALSSGVPAAAIAYSSKTIGVFETCGQGSQVIDPRTCDTFEVVESLWACFQRRATAAAALAAALPDVKRQARKQMDLILRTVTSSRETISV